jgi:hypothetical protein
MQTARLGSAALIAVLLLAAWRPTAPLAEDVLTFDANGDGVPDLTIPDSDGNGTFEWPPGTRTLHGTLRFPAGHVIESSGYTTIKVDAVVVEQGATLVEGLNLHQIVFTATHGDFTSQGRLRFGFFPGRFGVTAQLGSVSLVGSFFLVATTVSLQAPRGSITIQADPNGSERDLRAQTVSILARNTTGSIVIDNALVAGTTTLDNHASGSVPPTVDKGIRLIDGASVGGSNTTINATGRITLDAASISSDNVKLSTSRTSDDVCVGNGSLVRAVSGRINTSGVRGTPFRDETSTVTGPVTGKPFVVGACP